MAKAAPPPAPAGDDAAPKKSKRKLFVILAVVLVLLLGGGGAAAFFLMAPKGDAEAQAAHEEEPVGPPLFVVMDPFIVNLTEPDTTKYLQVGITYEIKTPTAAEELKALTPVIRSRILMVLSGKNVTNLSSIEGKQKLMDELVDLARVTLKGDGKDTTRGILDVHFSSFVIQ